MITREALGQTGHKNSGDPIFTEDFNVPFESQYLEKLGF